MAADFTITAHARTEVIPTVADRFSMPDDMTAHSFNPFEGEGGGPTRPTSGILYPIST